MKLVASPKKKNTPKNNNNYSNKTFIHAMLSLLCLICLLCRPGSLILFVIIAAVIKHIIDTNAQGHGRGCRPKICCLIDWCCYKCHKMSSYQPPSLSKYFFILWQQIIFPFLYEGVFERFFFFFAWLMNLDIFKELTLSNVTNVRSC